MRNKGQTKAGSQKERVAQLFSEDIDAMYIGQRLGVTKKVVSARLSDIRRDLGWQAV